MTRNTRQLRNALLSAARGRNSPSALLVRHVLDVRTTMSARRNAVCSQAVRPQAVRSCAGRGRKR